MLGGGPGRVAGARGRARALPAGRELDRARQGPVLARDPHADDASRRPIHLLRRRVRPRGALRSRQPPHAAQTRGYSRPRHAHHGAQRLGAAARLAVSHRRAPCEACALNDDVLCIKRRGADGQMAPLLRSTRASRTRARYACPSKTMRRRPHLRYTTSCAAADGCAEVRLWPLGTSVVYSQRERRLQKPHGARCRRAVPHHLDSQQVGTTRNPRRPRAALRRPARPHGRTVLAGATRQPHRFVRVALCRPLRVRRQHLPARGGRAHAEPRLCRVPHARRLPVQGVLRVRTRERELARPLLRLHGGEGPLQGLIAP